MIYVNSEIGKLKRVLVHRPDEGISRISPKRAEELLFDDIVYLPKMQEEHDIFTSVLKLFLGEENVIEVQDLLKEGLDQDENHRTRLINKIIDWEELPQSFFPILNSKNNEDLAKILISGYSKEEDYILFDPIPNFIFTRDIAVTVKDHIVITKAAKEARYRENLLTRFILNAHPIFKGMKEQGRIINLNDIEAFPPSKKGEKVSIEGGDMMMLADKFMLIGCSERTTDFAIQSLKKVLFEKDLVDNVVQINIPNDRTCMHIDTLFTRINSNDVVGYKPTVFDGVSSNVIVYRKSGDKEIYNSVKEFFRAEVNRETNFIFSGNGESPYQEREQWTDGCNLVALKPGVGLTYERNPKTEIAFREAGYEILPATELLERAKAPGFDISQINKTIITLQSSELSRARGGSHCMTCPIEREKE